MATGDTSEREAELVATVKTLREELAGYEAEVAAARRLQDQVHSLPGASCYYRARQLTNDTSLNGSIINSQCICEPRSKM